MHRICTNVQCYFKNYGYFKRHLSQSSVFYENIKTNKTIAEILKQSIIEPDNSMIKSQPNKKIKKVEYERKQEVKKDKDRSSKVDKFFGTKRLTKIDKSPYLEKPQVIKITKGMSINELAQLTSREPDKLAEHLEKMSGIQFNLSTSINNVSLLHRLVKTCGYRPVIQHESNEQQLNLEDVPQSKGSSDLIPSAPDSPENCSRRPPVVTIMGHVDHGKTTLLDSLRSSRIVDQEFGGITQHIGAFTVHLKDCDLPVVFLDTPGHAAFTSMRERGANCTDIVVLVVAADDGIMPQTVQSIRMAKQAGTPIIVAINKIDKTEAKIEKIKMLLSTHGLMVEDYGGDVQCVLISALKNINIDKLQEAITIQAEIMELSASHSVPVHGVVIESFTKLGLGKVSVMLVQRGVLKLGQYLVAGRALCKVKTMENDLGERVKEVLPGYPVTVTGWKDLPDAGEIVLQAESLQRANSAIRYRSDMMNIEKAIEDQAAYTDRMSEYQKAYKSYIRKRKLLANTTRLKIGMKKKIGNFTNLIETDDSTDTPRFSSIIRADVDGSIEAIMDLLSTYNSHDLCKLDIMDFGVGPPTSSDLQRLKEANGVLYLFNVDIPDSIAAEAKDSGVAIRYHNVIYHFADDVKQSLEDKYLPIYEEEVLGEAEVVQMFQITESKKKKVWVAGSRCITGNLIKNQLFKVLRFKVTSDSQAEENDYEMADEQSESILAEALSCLSLKHKKDDLEIIKRDMECGIRLDFSEVVGDTTDDNNSLLIAEKEKSFFNKGDRIICYKVITKKRTINWDVGF